MRIGIVPVLDSARGGVYQYSLSILRALAEIGERDGDSRVAFSDEPAAPALAGWETRPLTPPTTGRRTVDALRMAVGEGPHRDLWRALRRRAERKRRAADPFAAGTNAPMGRWFRRCGVDLLLFPAPDKLAFESGLPYVMAVHDLQHRLQPEFPEVSAGGEGEAREYLFRNGCRRATLILADSPEGREDILRLYGGHGVTPDRVKILPYLPASYLPREVPAADRRRVRAAYGLPERYLFYPAQFWPHKNHERLVRAAGRLKRERGLAVSLVFAGSRDGELRGRTFDAVAAAARELGIPEQVRFLGYVPEEDMAPLYVEAAALAMPTFFGPTNIPVLEAWAFGCPVLTSNLRGIREQAGDAALLVDPRSVESIAEGIGRLWTDPRLRASLAERGRLRLSRCSPADFRDRLQAVLDEARGRLGAAGARDDGADPRVGKGAR